MAKSSGLKNAPAATGNKSGKGRANNPPAKPASQPKFATLPPSQKK